MTVDEVYTTPDYFAALQIPILMGRSSPTRMVPIRSRSPSSTRPSRANIFMAPVRLDST